MRVYRTLLLAALIVVTPFGAGAQFGGMPGLPGGTPGGAPGTFPPGFGGQPVPRPPACQPLFGFRDETQKHGKAIQEAIQRKEAAPVVCRLYKSYLTAEAKSVNSLEENSQACGVPADVIKQVKEGHTKNGQLGKQVCDAAAQGRGPRLPMGDYWMPGDRMPGR
jgi:hypothetical protein